MKKHILYLCLFSPVFLAGCLNREVAEDSVNGPSSDVDAVTISADFLAENGDSTKTVLITSNRSWSAHLNDSADPVPVGTGVGWAYLEEDGFLNLSNTTVTKELKIIFLSNKVNVPKSGVLEIYSEGRLAKTIGVNQLGAVYRLDASVESTEIKAAAGEVTINVDCNTAWTAKVADGATASVNLVNDSGYESGELRVSFGENFSTKQTKSASIVISAEDCDDKVITFSQALAVPYLTLVSSPKETLDPSATTGTLSFKTNCDWTIETTQTTFRNFKLESTSGLIEDETAFEIPYTFNFSDDPKVVSTASFRISVSESSISPVTVDVTQYGHFNLEFAAMTFTPSLPTVDGGTILCGMRENGLSGNEHWLGKEYYDETNNSISFKFKTAEGNEYAIVADARLNARDHIDSNLKALYLFNLGNGQEVAATNGGAKNVPPYWSYPGVEGMVLKRLIYHCVYDSSNSNKNRFNCWLFPGDYRYGQYGYIDPTVSKRNTVPTYGIYKDSLEATRLGEFRGGNAYTKDTDFEIDLEKMNIKLPAGQGITVASIIAPAPPNQCNVRAVELFYEPAN